MANVAVCGVCGAVDDKKGDGGLCSHCGGDHWVEIEDFCKSELNDYIEKACENIKLSEYDLFEKLCTANGL